MKQAMWVAFGSILVGIIVLVLKYIAYLQTDSVALYSDAMESIINVITSVITFGAVYISAAPPDRNHPYGHSKVEYISAVLQGSFIILAAFLIMNEVIGHGIQVERPAFSSSGLWINFIASLINGLWAIVLWMFARKIHSPALKADSLHLFTDVVTSVGVLLGVFLVLLSGWLWLDSLIAAAVALHILWSGWTLTKDSVDGLMDKMAPETDIQQLQMLIKEHGQGAIQAHGLKARRAGATLFVEFHLVVPAHMSVAESHRICDAIEAAFSTHFISVMPSIHVEPDENAEHDDAVNISR